MTKEGQHLGDVLYMLAELHPDDQCRAYVEALAYYNIQYPNEQIVPEEGYSSRIVTTGPLDRLLDRESGWQPIETAPKDGTRIWCWNGVGQTDAAWINPYKDKLYLWCDNYRRYISPLPTHWMPLPQPPKPTGQEKAGAV